MKAGFPLELTELARALVKTVALLPFAKKMTF